MSGSGTGLGTLAVDLVPFAVGLLVTPAAIAVAILFLASRRAGANATAFAAAFGVVYGVLSAVVLTLTGTRTGPLISTTTKGIVGVVVGGVLLGAALVEWLSGRGTASRPPRWMAEIEGAGPGRAFGLGMVLAIANPNVAILLGGLAAIAATDLPLVDEVLGAFLLLAASTVALVAPIVAYVLAPGRVAGVLATIRAWLVRHQQAVNLTVFVVFGVLFLVRGLADVR